MRLAVLSRAQYSGCVKPTATAVPASAPSARIPAAGTVKRRFAVSFVATSRQSSPIGTKRNGRVTIATMPSAAAATARAELIVSRSTAADSTASPERRDRLNLDSSA